MFGRKEKISPYLLREEISTRVMNFSGSPKPLGIHTLRWIGFIPIRWWRFAVQKLGYWLSLQKVRPKDNQEAETTNFNWMSLFLWRNELETIQLSSNHFLPTHGKVRSKRLKFSFIAFHHGNFAIFFIISSKEEKHNGTGLLTKTPPKATPVPPVLPAHLLSLTALVSYSECMSSKAIISFFPETKNEALTNRCRPRSRSHRRREPGCQRPQCPPGDQRRPTEALKVRHLSRPCSPARHGPQWKWGPVPRLQPHAACCHATPEELWSSHLAAACRWRMPPQPTPAGWSYVPCSQRKLLWGHRLAAIDAGAITVEFLKSSK